MKIEALIMIPFGNVFARPAGPRQSLVKRAIPNIAVTMLIIAFSQMAVADDKPPQAGMCVACHGATGVSVNPQWPSLAGQKETYLANQMKAMRSGDRENALMAPFVKPLSDDDIQVLARYYAGQIATAAATGAAELVASGHNLRAYCVSCHGMAGKTANDEWPNLAGQQADYLYQQLAAFKSGEREHAIMSTIVAPFAEKEFRALAAYYSQLQP